MQAMAPAIIAGAFLFAVLPWMPTNWRPARVALALLSGRLLLRYLVWRYQATLPPISEPVNWLAGWAFYIIEVAGADLGAAVAAVPQPRARPQRRSGRPRGLGTPRRGGAADRRADLHLNEEQRILEHTILGAMGMDYPNFRTWVLDDGRRPWLKALCERLGAGYITRPDNAGAKAGNINHALARAGEAARAAAVHLDPRRRFRAHRAVSCRGP